jgi:ectoine hydroxylase-related dioxygenase (phytanoyl-CoA dioxygenase family)
MLAQLETEIDIDSLLTPEDQRYVKEPVTEALVAGDATVHDGLMLHRASHNHTGRPRRGWAIRFMPPATLYTGADHWEFNDLGLEPQARFVHNNFPVVDVTESA